MEGGRREGGREKGRGKKAEPKALQLGVAGSWGRVGGYCEAYTIRDTAR